MFTLVKNPYYQDPNGKEMADILMPVSPLEKNVFFENNNGKLNFVDESSGLDVLSNSRSASFFDYDNDGDLDIIVNNYHEAAMLFKNNVEKAKRNWLKVKLIGDPKQKVNRDAIGTKLLITLPNGQTIWREVRSTDGYMSVHPKQQHVGLGTANTVDIEVIWPNGKTQTLSNVTSNQELEISL
jgi:ASPIC and UnbV.